MTVIKLQQICGGVIRQNLWKCIGAVGKDDAIVNSMAVLDSEISMDLMWLCWLSLGEDLLLILILFGLG